jgi:Skp family chaperone for outer membrane proteins
MTEIDPGVMSELDRILSDPAAMAGKLQELAQAARSEFDARQANLDAAMERVIEAKAKATAEHDAREHAVANREAAASAREVQLAADRQKLSAQEAHLNNRLLDLNQRIRSVGAA